MEHASETIIARANVVRIVPAETDGTGEPNVYHLYLDKDAVYRWYHEDGTATDVTGSTVHSAFAAARLRWPDFELMEYRGRTVESEHERDIRDVYAADELQSL
jgi:hypothetical protein